MAKAGKGNKGGKNVIKTDVRPQGKASMAVTGKRTYGNGK